MNIFFVIGDELITPALQGSILPGITRDTVLQLGRQWGLAVSERRIAIDEVLQAAETGKLREVFGSGTAAVISPVGQIKYGKRVVAVGDGQVGALASRFYNAITDIQYGRAQGPQGWVVPVA